MRGFKRTVSLLIVICVMITCCSVNTNTVEAAAIAVKKGSEISEIKINETTQKVTAKEINHKAGWYKKSGVQYYFNKNKTTASYKWENKTLYQWKNGCFKKYNGVCKLSDGKYYYFKKSKKQYALCTGYVTLSDGKRYKFTNGKKDVTKVTPAKKYNDIPGPVNNILNSGRNYTKVYDDKGNLEIIIDNYGYSYYPDGSYANSNIYE